MASLESALPFRRPTASLQASVLHGAARTIRTSMDGGRTDEAQMLGDAGHEAVEKRRDLDCGRGEEQSLARRNHASVRSQRAQDGMDPQRSALIVECPGPC